MGIRWVSVSWYIFDYGIVFWARKVGRHVFASSFLRKSHSMWKSWQAAGGGWLMGKEDSVPC